MNLSRLGSSFFSATFLIKQIGLYWDSGHIQLAKYEVFDEGSDVQIKDKQILEPDGKNNKT